MGGKEKAMFTPYELRLLSFLYEYYRLTGDTEAEYIFEGKEEKSVLSKAAQSLETDNYIEIINEKPKSINLRLSHVGLAYMRAAAGFQKIKKPLT